MRSLGQRLSIGHLTRTVGHLTRTVLRRAAAQGILALVITSGALASLADPTSAAFPGRPGPIAFQSTRAGGLSVWLVNPNGSGLRQFSEGGGGGRKPRLRQYSPAVSPNGRRIAYVSSRVTGNGVWSNLFVKGIGVRGLNNPGVKVFRRPSPRGIESVAFAPGGRRVVFSAVPRGGGADFEIFTIRFDGRALRQLTHNQVQDIEPTFSRSGLIAFAQLHDRGRPPGALFGRANIAVIRPGWRGRQLLTFAARGGGEDRNPSFAPFGSWVAYERTFPDRRSPGQINETRLGSHRSRTLFVGRPEPGGFDEPHNPAYSPDGDSVVFDRTVYDAIGQITNPDLFQVERSGKAVHYVTGLQGEYDTEPDWGPNR
jgi:Tol biopolymer transport system component